MRAGRRSLALHLAIAGGVLGWVAVALIHGGGLTFFERDIPVPGDGSPVAALRETLLALFTTALLTLVLATVMLRTTSLPSAATIPLAVFAAMTNALVYFGVPVFVEGVFATAAGVRPSDALGVRLLCGGLAWIVAVPLGIVFGLAYTPFVVVARAELGTAVSLDSLARVRRLGAAAAGGAAALLAMLGFIRPGDAVGILALAAVLAGIALLGGVKMARERAALLALGCALRRGAHGTLELVPLELAVQTDETIGLTGDDHAKPTLAVVARSDDHGAYRNRPVALAVLGGCYRGPAMHAEAERGGVAGERT